MKDNVMFKTGPLYKEMALLTMISKNKDITQRDIAKEVKVSASMINEYLERFEKAGLIKRVYYTKKNVEYEITKLGIERKKVLNITYLESSLKVYNQAKEECASMIYQIREKGYKNVLFYGAGEVAEIMLYVIENTKELDFNVLAIIDDDKNKQNSLLVNTKIIDRSDINKYNFDAIVISSYTNSKIIYEKIQELNVEKKGIIQLFE